MVAQEGGSLFFGDMVIVICLCSSGWSHTMHITVALIGLGGLLQKTGMNCGEMREQGSLKGVEWEINEYYPNVLYTHMKFSKKNIKSLHNKNKDWRDKTVGKVFDVQA